MSREMRTRTRVELVEEQYEVATCDFCDQEIEVGVDGDLHSVYIDPDFHLRATIPNVGEKWHDLLRGVNRAPFLRVERCNVMSNMPTIALEPSTWEDLHHASMTQAHGDMTRGLQIDVNVDEAFGGPTMDVCDHCRTALTK